MNDEDMILGCERVARDLLYNDPSTDRKEDTSEGTVSAEFRFAVQEHLAYTEMIIERHLSVVPIACRESERARLDQFTPTVRELRRRFLATNGAL